MYTVLLFFQIQYFSSVLFPSSTILLNKGEMQTNIQVQVECIQIHSKMKILVLLEQNS